jgi:hypothetical protein
MAPSQRQGIFGISLICLYDLVSGLPITMLKIVNECNLNFQGESADLMGGAQMFPYDSEVTSLKTDLSVQAQEYNAVIMEKLMAGIKTERAAEVSGAVEALANVKGTSVFEAITGIASVIAIPSTGAANLKSGRYVIKAVSASTIDVYACQDIDHTRGTKVDFVDDTLKITPTPITVSTTTDLTDFGLRIAKGSGTLALTIGDTAVFNVRKPNAGSFDIEFGNENSQFPQFGLLCFSQKKTDGSYDMVEIYRAKAVGMPVNFKAKSWGEWSGTFKPLYDSAKGAVGRFRSLKAA